MNYAELSAAINNFAEDFGDNFNQFVPLFIRQAEQRIYNTCQLPATRQYVSMALSSGVTDAQLPSGYLSIHEVSIDTIDGFKYLLNKDYSFLREAYPVNISGVPQFYAVRDDKSITVAPTPGTTYPMSVTYFGYPQSIVDAGTSWLGDNFDSALLYGALYEAAIFDKLDQDMVTYYKAQFDGALTLLKQLSEGKNTQDDYRAGHIRQGVK